MADWSSLWLDQWIYFIRINYSAFPSGEKSNIALRCQVGKSPQACPRTQNRSSGRRQGPLLSGLGRSLILGLQLGSSRRLDAQCLSGLSTMNNMRILIGFYLFTFLIFPILVLFSTSIGTFYDTFWTKATAPIALCTYQLSFSLSFVACLINTFFGFLVAWVLVRYNFPGQKIVDAMIDLPFSLPTSVAGLSLCAIYGSKGWFGSFLIKNGIQVVFSKLGILLAMIFVSFPFVIRSIQPVLMEIDKQLEEAAWCLGATSWQTFSKIVWPTLIPALITGIVLSFSRCIGEYGSIVLLSSNFPFKDLITPVLIFQCLEQYDYTGATVFGSVLLFFCFFFFLFVNIFQTYFLK